ncbi:MAG: DNA helicase [candidate division SR1 bacterium]|nr:MAG: DNA helicase [candidate division SR1 bacterium]
MEQQNNNFTNLLKIEKFSDIMRKIDFLEDLDSSEKEYILSVAIICIDKYKQDDHLLSYLNFAYYIILHYTIITGDDIPLLDFSTNLGLYPITNKILEKNRDKTSLLEDIIYRSIYCKYSNNAGYVETFKQKVSKQEILESDSSETAYIAPTSYGKSELIIELLKKRQDNERIAIIVPSKSLLVQTYKNIVEAELDEKIILHDGMYNGEDSFIAILTQERALRLLEEQDVFFNQIIIDEAHNLLDGDSRCILLTRLIRKNYLLNPNQKIYYLSPLIEDVNNIRIHNQIKFSSIKFNMKIPKLYQFSEEEREEKLYNRFLGKFYDTNFRSESWIDYIRQKSGNKKFVFETTPKKIEILARNLADSLPRIETEDIQSLCSIIKKHVHEDFYVLDLLQHGVLYLHGAMPYLIKEFLEKQFKINQGIQYLVANTVILEGINLPIDALFISSCYNQNIKKIINLIGRVNRLNDVFLSEEFNIHKLLPKIHFLKEKNSKIEKLRTDVFKDEVKNPILNSSGEEIKNEEKNQKTIQQENFVLENYSEDKKKIKKDIISLGIASYYNNIDILIDYILELEKKQDTITLESIFDEIYRVFFNNISNIFDYEIRRLSNQSARDYYKNYILITAKKSIKENIANYLDYYRTRILRNDVYLYVGEQFGELEYPYPTEGYDRSYKKLYINLREKSKKELVNITIHKLKVEEDFVSFHLTKFIEFLYKYAFIPESVYNEFMYGTNEEDEIKLIRYGLSLPLIAKLKRDNQISNLEFDINNNLIGNEEFQSYLETMDDFEKFEIQRYLVML